MAQADQDLLALVTVQLQLVEAAIQLFQQSETLRAAFIADNSRGQIEADKGRLIYGFVCHGITFFQDEETPAHINAPAFCSVGLITVQVWLVAITDI